MKHDVRVLEAALAQIDSQHLRRRRSTVESFPETGSRAEVIVEGRRLVDFCSNDYLGLARHPDIAHAMSEAALRVGAGSGAAHLVTGHGVEHARLEEELAAFTGRERALLFSTGYMANLAVITSLANRGDLVLLDRLSHASLIDAAQLSGARFKRYAHNDIAAAERVLREQDAPTPTLPRETGEGEDIPSPGRRGRARVGASLSVIATDGVFSMDGDIAPLPALAHLSREHQAWLVVDDAHGLGVLGKSGRGSCEHFGLNSDDVPVLIGTLGKAFGSFGAFVAGSAQLIELLIQKARSYIYTTALPQPVAAATREALKVAQREPWRRERVLALTARFRKGAAQLGLPIAASETPIQPLMLGSAEAAVSAQRKLLDAGFWVSAIRPPTVPAGSARLRITLSAAHTEAQVDALLDALVP